MTAPHPAARVLIALPERIPVAFAGVLLAGVITAALHVFVPAVTLPLAAVLATVFVLLAPRTRGARRGSAAAAVVALAGAAAWAVVQIPFAGQFLRANRDPGIYTLVGIWMAKHGAPSIDVSAQQQLARSVGGGLAAALPPGTLEPGGLVQFQGGDGMTSIVGMGYWAGGLTGALTVNLLVGAVALLALYAVARRLTGPWLALLAPVLLGASMPMAYFSRLTYTEISALVVILSAVAVLVGALRDGRARTFALAGVLAGSAYAARVDMLLASASLMVALALLGLARPDRVGPRAIVTWLGGAWAALGVAQLDLAINDRDYLHDLGRQVVGLLAVALVASAAGLIIAIAQRRGRPIGWPVPTAGRRLWIVGAVVTVVLIVFWLSRPAWLVYRSDQQEAYRLNSIALETQAGLPLDGSRTFDEYSFYWFAWYFGWPFVVAAWLGVIALLRTALLRRTPAAVVVLALFLPSALLYIDLISIAADQIWAARRMLPVVFPGLVLGAVLVVDLLWRRRSRGRRSLVVRRVVAVAVVVASVAGIGLSWSRPVVATPEFDGQRAEATQLCTAVRGADVVVVTGDIGGNLALTFPTVCDVPALTLPASQKASWRSTLARLASSAGGRVVVVAEHPESLPWAGAQPAPTVTAGIRSWSSALFGAPATVSGFTRSTWVADVAADGTLTAR